MSYQPIKNEIFHVHTYRCKHAEKVPDSAYVEKAIELGTPRIVFTDHAPFPDNPFNCRMDMEDLEGYVSTISQLKKDYHQDIEILLGLEIEYLPSYEEYYKELKASGDYDVLVLGSHFSEIIPRQQYSFDRSKEEMIQAEAIDCSGAMVAGIKTGLFDVVAHPDRAFRRRLTWTDEESAIARKMIGTAVECGVYLEKNRASMKRKNHYRTEFWDLVPPEAKVLIGYDAHSLKELVM